MRTPQRWLRIVRVCASLVSVAIKFGSDTIAAALAGVFGKDAQHDGFSWPSSPALDQFGHGRMAVNEVLRSTSQIVNGCLIGIQAELLVKRCQNLAEVDGPLDDLAA